MPQPGDSDLLSNTDGWSSKDTPDAELIKDESQISLDSPHKPLLKSSDAHTSFSNTSVDEHVKKVVPPLPSAGPMPVRPPSPSGTTVYSQQTSHTIVPLAMAMSAPMQMAVMPPYVGYVPGYVDLKVDEVTQTESFLRRGNLHDADVRAHFIQKVYLVLFVQLAFTTGMVYVFTYIGVFFVLYVALMCSDAVRRFSPLNVVLLFIFTLALCYLLGTMASFHKTVSVFAAVGICAGVCLSISVFALQVKRDFTSNAGLFFSIFILLLMFGVISIFTYSKPWFLSVVYGTIASLIFILFVVIDTRMIVNGRRYKVTPDEHVYMALTLYIDFVYIFFYAMFVVNDSAKALPSRVAL